MQFKVNRSGRIIHKKRIKTKIRGNVEDNSEIRDGRCFN